MMPSGKHDFHCGIVDRRHLDARSSSSSEGETPTALLIIARVNGAQLGSDCFRCSDLAVGSGNAQAGASKVGMQRGHSVVQICVLVKISRVPENQVEISDSHHDLFNILGTTAM